MGGRIGHSTHYRYVISLLFWHGLFKLLSESSAAVLLSFPMILLATSCRGKEPDMTKKSWKNTKAQRAGGCSGRGGHLWPDRSLGLAMQPGHSNSERMLMRLLWSLWCFPCFQHLQGPHGARSIKTTKWEIWTFFCNAGGLFAFQPGRPFSVPPQKEKIRKRVLRGVWMSKLFRKIAYLRTWRNNQFMATQGQSLWRRKNPGFWNWKGANRMGREMLKFGGCFLTTAVMRSLTSWASLHYSPQTTGS